MGAQVTQVTAVAAQSAEAIRSSAIRDHGHVRGDRAVWSGMAYELPVLCRPVRDLWAGVLRRLCVRFERPDEQHGRKSALTRSAVLYNNE